MNRYIPPRFIPDEEVRLGRPPRCRGRGCFNPASDAARSPKGFCDECFEQRFSISHTEGPDCPLCGGSTIDLDHGPVYCVECDTRDPHTEEEELRRQSRLRDAHNDGNFMPKSVDEWRERHDNDRDYGA